MQIFIQVRPLLLNLSVSSFCLCLGPLAGTISWLLDGVADPGGIATAVKLHRAPLQPCLPAALAEASVRVDVVVVDAGRGTLPITGYNIYLKDIISKDNGMNAKSTMFVLTSKTQVASYKLTAATSFSGKNTENNSL